MKIDAADKWFSKCVRERANWACERCRKWYAEGSPGLHCSHLFGRRHKATRWHPMNAFAHCYACHQYLGSNPVEFAIWAERYMSPLQVEVVRRLHLAIYKTNAELRRDIARHYQREHASLIERRNGGLHDRLEFEAYPGLPTLEMNGKF